MAELGDIAPDAVGPISVQAPNGVVDVVVPDEAAAVSVSRQLLGYFRGPAAPGVAPDQTALRTIVPERARRLPGRADHRDARRRGSVIFLRQKFAPELVTALARIRGRPVGVIANSTTMVMAGAITAAASDKAARFLQLCDAFGIPVVSLVDCPGFMVGPTAEAEALVRRGSRLLIAGAALRVPR